MVKNYLRRGDFVKVAKELGVTRQAVSNTYYRELRLDRAFWEMPDATQKIINRLFLTTKHREVNGN